MDRLAELAQLLRGLASAQLSHVCGEIVDVAEARLSVSGLSSEVRLGDKVILDLATGSAMAVVVRIQSSTVTVIPCERDSVVRIGDRVRAAGQFSLAPHASWAGRVLNGLGMPIDGGGHLVQGAQPLPLHRPAPPAMARGRVGGALRTGVKVIDLFTPLVAGQRVGIFAGSGVGKSTLLAMLAQSPPADIVVLALIGERGREVRDFLDDALQQRRERVVAVVATSDDSATMRRFAPAVAMTIAEHARDSGRNVLLIMDSLTRFAHAQRDHALASGEPPVARGYPPSVFREMAGLLERAGPGRAGSGQITLVATVLVDGDDHNDPVADAVRGFLDGHLVLDRKIAGAGRWPALDPLASISRLADLARSPAEARVIADALRLINRFEETKDIRSLGDYRPGADAALDRAVAIVPEIYRLLVQQPGDAPVADPHAALASLLQLRPSQSA